MVFKNIYKYIFRDQRERVEGKHFMHSKNKTTLSKFWSGWSTAESRSFSNSPHRLWWLIHTWWNKQLPVKDSLVRGQTVSVIAQCCMIFIYFYICFCSYFRYGYHVLLNLSIPSCALPFVSVFFSDLSCLLIKILRKKKDNSATPFQHSLDFFLIPTLIQSIFSTNGVMLSFVGLQGLNKTWGNV